MRRRERVGSETLRRHRLDQPGSCWMSWRPGRARPERGRDGDAPVGSPRPRALPAIAAVTANLGKAGSRRLREISALSSNALVDGNGAGTFAATAS